jgi:integrase/recombinase XerD
MLITHVERYLALRCSLGIKLQRTSRRLRDFARFADASGDTYVRATTAVMWATAAPTPDGRYRRLADVMRLGRFLQAEDSAHEVPPTELFHAYKTRWVPYIYTLEEQARVLEAAGQLRIQKRYPLRRQTYVMLFGLLAATGLRVSEALGLTFSDLLPGGVLSIRDTKFGKSRLVPLHPTAVDAFARYLEVRRRVATANEYVFLSAQTQRIPYRTAHATFRRLLLIAGITPKQDRWPRIHDYRHSFATRALEQCTVQREGIARHFVALSTYMGHVDIASTYWYLQVTPSLMAGMACAAEALMAKEVA